jgi:ribonuclease R
MVENEYALVGRRTGLRFRMGDKVRVRVVAANLDKRQIDYTILELPVQKQPKRQGSMPERAAVKPSKQGSGRPQERSKPSKGRDKQASSGRKKKK